MGIVPPYDVTYAFSPDNIWIKLHQMSVRGKVEKIDRNDLKIFAHEAGIKDPDDIIDTVISTASQWEEYANMSEVPKESIISIEKSCLRTDIESESRPLFIAYINKKSIA